MPRKSARAARKTPEKVQITVVLTPEGVEKAEEQLAALKTRLRQQAREKLKRLAGEVRAQNASFNENEVVADIEEAVHEVREEMRTERGTRRSG